MNVTELARRLGITPNKLREIMPRLGFDIGARAIKVDAKMAQAIMEKLADAKTRDHYLGDKIAMNEPRSAAISADGIKDKVIKVPDKITVKELARRMDIPVTNLMLELMKNGVMASLNQNIDFETALIIAEDMGYRAEKSEQKDEQATGQTEQYRIARDYGPESVSRAPVVVVMGHVDHGKTKLLDAIRETNVMEGEAGGITQHIGAYQVIKDGRPLTFIDTPGHEAFSAMRSRGAKVADIAILLVAADDGVQPQTIEAVSHIKNAELPMIVAINKIDKPGANIDKVKHDLANIGLTPEDWGGQAVCVEVSAKERINIPELLDTLFLVADLRAEEIRANPNKTAEGTIVESHVDKGEGPVATVLVQTGTLRRGEAIRIGGAFGKIRAMKNWKGEEVFEAGPSMPVKILGLKTVPAVGEILRIIKDKREMRQITKIKKGVMSMAGDQRVMDQSSDKEEGGGEDKPKINIILKSDVLGSSEAIIESLGKINQKRAAVEVIKRGLGNITEKDIDQAKELGAHLVGFNVKITNEASKVAADRGVTIKQFYIIYDLIDFVEDEVKKAGGKEIALILLGKLKVLEIFRTGKKEQIAGGEVVEGKIKSGNPCRIVRGREIVAEARLTEIESGKEKVKEVAEGQQCGIKIEGFNRIKAGDAVEVYQEEEK